MDIIRIRVALALLLCVILSLGAPAVEADQSASEWPEQVAEISSSLKD